MGSTVQLANLVDIANHTFLRMALELDLIRIEIKLWQGTSPTDTQINGITSRLQELIDLAESLTYPVDPVPEFAG